MLIQIMAMPFQSQLNDKSTGMTAAGIKASKLKEIPVILPPYQEQTRIVSRVQDLMSLCDQLEQHSLTSLDAHQQLVETLLTTLTDSLNADELAENWARISEHFDTLFTTEASIDALKQTILQLAVMGKLVPQDPNDKPASELLKRIAQEKAQLVKDGKIKKQNRCHRLVMRKNRLNCRRGGNGLNYKIFVIKSPTENIQRLNVQHRDIIYFQQEMLQTTELR